MNEGPHLHHLGRKTGAVGLSRGAHLPGLINGAQAVLPATDRRGGVADMSNGLTLKG